MNTSMVPMVDSIAAGVYPLHAIDHRIVVWVPATWTWSKQFLALSTVSRMIGEGQPVLGKIVLLVRDVEGLKGLTVITTVTIEAIGHSIGAFSLWGQVRNINPGLLGGRKRNRLFFCLPLSLLGFGGGNSWDGKSRWTGSWDGKNRWAGRFGCWCLLLSRNCRSIISACLWVILCVSEPKWGLSFFVYQH